MQYIRPANERGNANFGWLNSHHSFSFGQYYDPSHMGISALRVINDDTVSPGAGFDTHGHRNMEIISYILEGTIEHRDSEGNIHQLPAGELQRMSAGRGITHSEYNASKDSKLRFLQIWIQPNVSNIPPEYEQKTVPDAPGVHLLLSPNGEEDSLTLHQQAWMYQIKLTDNEEVALPVRSENGYLHLVEGEAYLTENAKAALNLGPADAVGGRLDIESQYALKSGNEGLTALWFNLP